jgi:TLC ATP/ADP transporter
MTLFSPSFKCKKPLQVQVLFFISVLLLQHQGTALRLFSNKNPRPQFTNYSAKASPLLKKSANTIRGGEQQAEEQQLQMTADATDAACNANAKASNAIATTSTSITSEENALVKFRKAVFPIYGQEIKKFFYISSIKFYIILALTLTRDTKDTLVVTQCGAEAIAFLKVRTLSRHVLFLFFIILHALSLSYFYQPNPFATGNQNCYIDLWSFASCHSIHCLVLQNVRCPQQKKLVLRYMHTILSILWDLRHLYIPKHSYSTSVFGNRSKMASWTH